MAMTEAALRKICREQDLYITPGLNESLYCNFQGFTSIGGLENYTSLRSLFLEGNALSSLEGLPRCHLTCLYLQSNFLENLKGLENVPNLEILNVSSNELTSLQGLAACPKLSSFTCASNRLANAEAVSELRDCSELTTLDIQSNRLEDCQVLELVKSLPALCCLYIKDNPMMEAVRNCRKTMIASIPTLTYLDDFPVKDTERVCAEAWHAGGPEAEEAARIRCQEQASAKEKENFDVLLAMRKESFRKVEPLASST